MEIFKAHGDSMLALLLGSSHYIDMILLIIMHFLHDFHMKLVSCNGPNVTGNVNEFEFVFF